MRVLASIVLLGLSSLSPAVDLPALRSAVADDLHAGRQRFDDCNSCVNGCLREESRQSCNRMFCFYRCEILDGKARWFMTGHCQSTLLACPVVFETPAPSSGASAR